MGTGERSEYKRALKSACGGGETWRHDGAGRQGSMMLEYVLSLERAKFTLPAGYWTGQGRRCRALYDMLV